MSVDGTISRRGGEGRRSGGGRRGTRGGVYRDDDEGGRMKAMPRWPSQSHYESSQHSM